MYVFDSFSKYRILVLDRNALALYLLSSVRPLRRPCSRRRSRSPLRAPALLRTPAPLPLLCSAYLLRRCRCPAPRPCAAAPAPPPPLRATVLPDTAVLGLSELHVALQKLRLLLADCARKGANAKVAASELRVVMGSLATAVDAPPEGVVAASDEARELTRRGCGRTWRTTARFADG